MKIKLKKEFNDLPGYLYKLRFVFNNKNMLFIGLSFFSASFVTRHISIGLIIYEN